MIYYEYKELREIKKSQNFIKKLKIYWHTIQNVLIYKCKVERTTYKLMLFESIREGKRKIKNLSKKYWQVLQFVIYLIL